MSTSVPREFEVREEILLDASPEQVWDAIATGPGVDSWFMGRTEIEEGHVGGRTTLVMGGSHQGATITDWDPLRRFAYRRDANDDGSFMALDFLIEARAQGSTLLRLVHNGMLGDDWEAQYDALSRGDGAYLRKLQTYLARFPGRTAVHTIFVVGEHQMAEKDLVWNAFRAAAGVPAEVTAGSRARIAIDGVPPVDGVVTFLNPPNWLSVCTDDAHYFFIQGYRHRLVVQYHGFDPRVDTERLDKAWQQWFDRTFTGTTA